MHLSYVNVFTLASRCPASQETNTSSIGFLGKIEVGHITLSTRGYVLRFENSGRNLFSCCVSSWSTYISRLSTSTLLCMASTAATALRSKMAPVRQHLFLALTVELTRLVTSLPPETRCSSASLLIPQQQKAVSMSRTTRNLSAVVSNIKGIRQMRLFLVIERK